MVWERKVIVEETAYQVMISDEQEALPAALAAGRVFIGLLTEGGDHDFPGAEYLVESLDVVDACYLERVVMRKLGLPWIIGASERLCVREFTVEDAVQIPAEPEETEADAVFHTKEKLAAYIRSQYRFFEYGVWAIVRKSDGVIVGKAGVTDVLWPEPMEMAEPCATLNQSGASGPPDMRLELGYHIIQPYRGCGYAQEACQLILRYVNQEYGCPVYASADSENEASNHILQKLGFRRLWPETAVQAVQAESTGQKYTKSEPWLYRYVWN
ncbi:MAG: GNAT family N-acetyltransferase [Lachnospiraceae bacterium]|nr:GNAT family N-acetyltransferase [Lachnospiraceae bacterium]